MGDEVLDRGRTFAKRGHRERSQSSRQGPTPDPEVMSEDAAPPAATAEDGAEAIEGESQMAEQMAEEGQAVDQHAEEAVHTHDAPAANAEANGHADANGSAPSGPGGLAAAADVRPCPIPSGSVIFGELTSAFVDGPRLLRFLGDRRHTGAVVDAGGDRVQVTILHDGDVLGMVSTSGGKARRLDSIELPAPGSSEADEHQLTVLSYRPEVAVAIGQLVNVGQRFERMHGSFVDFPALLAFLRRESAHGAVRVTTHEDTGIVLMRDGTVLGAYTARRPEIADPETLFELAKAPDAEIDVHVGALEMPPASVPVGQVVR
jgi:hypothetical protein